MYSSWEERIDRLVHDRKKSLWVVMLLAAAAYCNIFLNGYVLDDFSYIVDWPLIRNLINFPRFFIGFIPPEGHADTYSPLKTLLHSLIYILSNKTPVGFHVVALLTHVVAVYAAYLIASFLTRNAFISFLTALIFALHPIHVESITSMTASTDTLGIVVLLFSFYHYLKAINYEGSLIVSGSSVKPIAKQNTTSWFSVISLANYRMALGLAAVAIFTSELALSLPILFFFYDYGFSQAKRSWRLSLRRAIPFLFVVLFYCLLKSVILGGLSQSQYLEHSFYLTMMLMIKAWAKYIWLLFFPIQLTINHIIAHGIFSINPKDFDSYAVLSQSPLEPQTFLSLVILGVMVFAAGATIERRPLIAFGVGWFFISLLPVSNILPSPVYLSERFIYLGSLAFCILASYGIYLLYTSSLVKKSTIVACVVVLLAGYGARDLWRNRDWRDSIAIYESAVKANPQSAYLRNDLAVVYFQYGELDKAKANFETAIAMKPSESHFYFSAEETYSTLEQYDRSVDSLKKALELNPQFAEAYFNLAGLYAYLGATAEVRMYLARAVVLYEQQNRILEAGQAISSLNNFIHLPKNLSNDILLKKLPEIPQEK
jgi:hypothetical protein